MTRPAHICGDFYSPNFDKRPKNVIDTIVLHSTHLSFASSIKRLCDKVAKVSCHYLIDLDGQIYRLVEDDKRAWHAGISYWRGKSNLNNNSIGIELVDTTSKGLRIKRFPRPQMKSLIVLLKFLTKKYKIPSCNIVGHSDVAPDRKDDPGEFFDWQDLANEGIGHYHSECLKSAKNSCLVDPKAKEIQIMLKAYGYKIKTTGSFDGQTKDVITAFKRHFNPAGMRNDYFGAIDLKILSYLLH